ncbi:c-di-GMP-binding flagellar brake protein YcgR [Natronospira proteinivora]|uniref:C-di-GMP-binding flagellar brake protein YcgR n=1 Tax=Natronospira proteinivora TaxID=1807133 RepID=A0ABT1G552_9GAMM|nr:c-di-GMP-binding flagellar brake protein YcgR [Natronospira proteinivora]
MSDKEHDKQVRAGNSPGEDPTREDRPNRIRQLLIRLRDQRSLLSAHFRGRSDSFGTLLLNVDPDKGELEFDELSPTDGDRLVKLHQQFQVSGQLDGAQLSFPVKVLSRQIREGLASYRTTLPTAMRYHQRRKAFRVEAPVRPKCKVSISTTSGDVYDGQLADLSVTGAGFLMKTKKAEALPRGTHCDCEIELPSGSIQSAVEIRFNLAVQDKPFNRLGGQFTGLSAADRRRIERFVFELQRRQLKADR